jgi:hypothetical protein
MSMLESLVEKLGENGSLALGALLIGVAFGFMAQRSRFCLRSAVIEFARNHMGGKLTVWLFAFATAVGATQALAWAAGSTPAMPGRSPRAAACRARPSAGRCSESA